MNPKKILRCYLIALCEDSFSSIFLHSRNQTLSELFKLLLKTSGLISNLKFFWNIMSARYRAFFIHTYTLNCESECYWYAYIFVVMFLVLWTSHSDLICLSHCSIWCLWVNLCSKFWYEKCDRHVRSKCDVQRTRTFFFREIVYL